MTLYKNVNGIDVLLSAEEEAEVRAEWEYNQNNPTVPNQVTPLQMRRALRESNLLANVTSAVSNSSPELQEAWEYAVYIPRNDSLINSLGTALSLTTKQIDNLFILAGTK